MKKLFAAVLLLGALAPAHAAFPIFGTVQASTDTTYAPTLQPGAFNISSGTVVNLNVSTVSATNISVSSMTASTATITNLNVTSSATVTGPLTVVSSTTLRGNVGILGNVSQPLTVTSSVTLSGNAEVDGVFKATGTVTLGSAGNSVNISSTVVLNGTTIYAGVPTGQIATGTGTFTIVTASTLTATNIVGTATNDAGSVGNYGQWVSSVSAQAINMAGTQVLTDVASISLTAGDWDISGLVRISTAGATVYGNVEVGIGTVAGNNSTGMSFYENAMDQVMSTLSGISALGVTIPPWRASISTTTTYFLKTYVTYTAGTPTAQGRISARRMR